jgi:hypothetical protein
MLGHELALPIGARAEWPARMRGWPNYIPKRMRDELLTVYAIWIIGMTRSTGAMRGRGKQG